MSHYGSYGYDEDEEEEDSWAEERNVDDNIVFLVDARKAMHEPRPEDGRTYFDLALEAALALMKSKVMVTPTHKIGITLFGTTKTNQEEDMLPNIWELHSLDVPSAERIREVDYMLRDEDFDFDEKFGGKLDDGTIKCPLWAAFRSGTAALTSKKVKTVDYRRIWLFTNDDDPFSGLPTTAAKKEEERRIIRVVTDSIDTGLMIELWPFNKGGSAEPFDPNKFYTNVLVLDGEEDNTKIVQMGDDQTFASLISKVRKREVKKRRLCSVPFILREEPELALHVRVFNLASVAKRPAATALDAKTNKAIKVVTRMTDNDTGAALDEHEIRKYVELGQERIYMTSQERAKLQEMGPVGFRLLGFRPVGDIVKPELAMGAPYFIYPDEQAVTGSCKAFVALHTAMLSKGVAALVSFVKRAGSKYRMAALQAQEEVTNDEGEQVRAPGMHVIFLPFREEVREIMTNPGGDISGEEAEEQLEAATEAAKQLTELKPLRTQNFHCGMFDSPMLLKFYAAVQAQALKEEDLDFDLERDDTTLPKLDYIDAQAAAAIDAFKASFGADKPDEELVSGKRKAAGGGGPAKKVKGDNESDQDFWARIVKDGSCEKETIPSIKAYLKLMGQPVSGTKKVLLDRVKALHP